MMPRATSVLTMPIWAKPRAAPPPSANPITGRLTLPTLGPVWPLAPLWPRPSKFSNTCRHLLGAEILAAQVFGAQTYSLGLALARTSLRHGLCGDFRFATQRL